MTDLQQVRVRDMTDGDFVSTVLLVLERELRPKRDGKEYLHLVVGDQTAKTTIKVWDNVPFVSELVTAGEPLHVTGRYAVSQKYGAEIRATALRVPDEDEVDWDVLLEGPDRPVEELEAALAGLIKSVGPSDLQTLLYRALGDGGSEQRQRFVTASAARSVHHAYRHGLLEHTILVAQAVSAVCAVFPEIDRDVAVTGALLHDIGKLDAYTTDPVAIDLTDVGKLYGEIPLGFARLRGLIASIEGFDPDRARAILHVIISHHGSLEHGSPVAPATREASVVSALDGLGARLGIYDRLEKALPEGERWTAYERTINGRAYFGGGLP